MTQPIEPGFMVFLADAQTIDVPLDTDTASHALFEGIGMFEPSPTGVLLHSQADDPDWFAHESS